MGTLHCLLAAFLFSSALLAGDFEDNFGDSKHKTRKALRGDWTFENNETHCVSDPELYKKFSNHGPILRWPAEFTNGTIEFEFKPKDVQRLVITLNEKGHIFRIMLADESNPKVKGRAFGWEGPSKTTDAETITNDALPTTKALEGEWSKGKIAIDGTKAVVTLGPWTRRLDHASIGRQKGEFTISFASGELSVRKVKLTTRDAK